MNRRGSLLLGAAVLSLAMVFACGGGDGQAGQTVQEEPREAPPAGEIEILEWSIGAKGGLGDPGAFITQARWEPKKLTVPLGRPIKIRFVPRDDRFHIIAFGKSLDDEVGMDLEDLEVRDGQPAETQALTIKSTNATFDVFCREHRGVAGYGAIITAER